MSHYYDAGCGAEQFGAEYVKGNPESDTAKEGLRKVETAVLAIDAEKQVAAEQAAAEQAAAEQAAAEQAAAEQAAAEQAAAEQADNASSEGGRTVYYTQSGSKYHYENPCGRGTYYPCTLAEAEAMGLEPCGKCVLR